MTVNPKVGGDELAWPAVLDAAVNEVAAVVRSGALADWSAPAGRLEWDCRATVLHVASDFVGYAGQLTCPRDHGYVPFDVILEGDPEAGELAEVVRATGGLLSSVTRTTPSGILSWHPYGMAGPIDFCAMGVVEALVHAHDLAAGLGVSWEAPDALAARALGHLFNSEREQASWATLLRETGRIPGEDGVYVTQWRWYNTGS